MPRINYRKMFKAIEHAARKNPESVLPLTQHINENQLRSKRWLMDHLDQYVGYYSEPPKIVIAAGWYGLLGHMIHDRFGWPVTTFDKDDTVKQYGKMLYPNIEHKTRRVEDHDPFGFDILICTSCEHFSDDVINSWIAKRKKGSLVFLQSNNYYITEHTNCKGKISEFYNAIKMNCFEGDTLDCNSYDRYMLIGL